MGVKRDLDISLLPFKYHAYKLIASTDGISDSVYLLDDKYVLKLFESSSVQSIENEIQLLDKLGDLKVPKVIDRFTLDGKNCLIYTQVSGKSIENPNLDEIKQIAIFLKELHQTTKGKVSTNKDIFSKSSLKKLIEISQNEVLQRYFESINITLQNDGIIHGDLFYDNAKFEDGVLSGVYDFCEACNGDFVFDLAVLATSWCFDDNILDKQKVKVLLDTYGLCIDMDSFKEYIKYALLYYATNRYINNKNYKQLIKRLKNIC